MQNNLQHKHVPKRNQIKKWWSPWST
jgi:hypothetical protein